MKANGLMIGNWYDNNGNYYQVTPNTIQEVFESERVWCKPIPLTEEILLKCGFETTEWDNHNTYRKMIGNNDFTIVISSSGLCEIGDIYVKEVLWLHQLQNLIYILTNEELIVTF